MVLERWVLPKDRVYLRSFFTAHNQRMAKKLFVKTHGCQMNEYDSARMYDVLKDIRVTKLPLVKKRRTYYSSTPALFVVSPGKSFPSAGALAKAQQERLIW